MNDRYTDPREETFAQRAARATPDDLLRAIVRDNVRAPAAGSRDFAADERQRQERVRAAAQAARTNDGKGWYTPQTMEQWVDARYGGMWAGQPLREMKPKEIEAVLPAMAEARREEARLRAAEWQRKQNRLPLNGGGV